MSDDQAIRDFRRTVREAAEPLLGRVDEIGKEIEQAQEGIVALRAERNELLAAIRRVDPDLAPPLYPKSQNGKPRKSSSGAKRPSDEKLEAVHAWLLEHRDEVNANGGVYASGLAERDDFDAIPHQSGISKALAALRERELVVLDHEGRGGSKFYKVV